MNESILERFERSRRGHRPLTGQAEVMLLQPRLNEGIRQYFQEAKQSIDASSWFQLPEVPSSTEILDIEAGDSNNPSNVELVPNRPKGPWESKGE